MESVPMMSASHALGTPSSPKRLIVVHEQTP